VFLKPVSPFSRLLPALPFGSVTFKHPRGRKFTQLVAHHVLGDVDRDKFLPVVDGQGVADELRHDGRAARPSPHYFLLVLLVHGVDLDSQVVVHERSFM